MATVSGTLVPRAYGPFRGVDFRGEEVDLMRSPDALNMWKDYKETESIRTRPGMVKVAELPQGKSYTIHGVFFFTSDDREYMFVHANNELFKMGAGGGSLGYVDEPGATQSSNSFMYGDVLYFKSGYNFYQYKGKGLQKVEPYVPTTRIGADPAGGGVVHEDVNLLSSKRKNTFVGDGESKVYHLDTTNIDNEKPIVTVNGILVGVDSYDTEAGTVTLNVTPPAPQTAGQDNVCIEFSKKSWDNYRKIGLCTLMQVFDNRVFVAGNPLYPNMLWHSSLDDPTYFSDLDSYTEGRDTSMIRALVPGNNALWVFKEPSTDGASVFYHTPTVDAEYGKIYPSSHSNLATGCTGTGINFSDDIVVFSDKGMEGIGGDILSEQVLAHRSSLVDAKLLAEDGYEDMILVEWEGYLLVIIKNKVYLADSRATFANGDHYEYEWFYWELEKEVSCAKVYKGVLYLGADDGVYTMTDTAANIASYWATPLDKFGYPSYQKTTNKRGCVVEAKGDITLHVKTDGTDWQLINQYKGVTDYFVSRIKKKKFKDIQLEFSSDTRFILEQATLECFVGGYIKR